MGVSILSGTVEGREAAVFVSRTTGTTFGPVMEDEATAHAFSEYLGEDPRKIPENKLIEAYHAFFQRLQRTSTKAWLGHCHRCGTATNGYTMSRFDTDLICDDCEGIEKAHPDYQRAVDVELAAVKAGDMNFPGIGKPSDL